MIEVAGGGFQTVGYAPYRITAGELTEHHAYEPAPCAVALTVFVRPRLFYDASDIFFGEL